MGWFIQIPYRWCSLWAIKSNIVHIYYSFVYGIANIFRYFKVVWPQQDFDWYYLATLMKYKLDRMADYAQNHGHHVSSERDAKNMRICSELLKRMLDDDDWNKQKYYQKYLGEMLGKHFMSWWD